MASSQCHLSDVSSSGFQRIGRAGYNYTATRLLYWRPTGMAASLVAPNPIRWRPRANPEQKHDPGAERMTREWRDDPARYRSPCLSNLR
jgi:hypothetical protein